MNRVVVTGYGMLTPLGLNSSENWNALAKSSSGIRRIDQCGEQFDEISSKIGGKVWGFDPAEHFSKKELRRYDPFIQYALGASREALKHAGLKNSDETIDLSRAGVAIGSGIGGLKTIQTETEKMHKRGASKISPFFFSAFPILSLFNYFGSRFYCS